MIANASKVRANRVAESVDIVLIGDNQYGAQVMRHIVHDVRSEQPDLFVIAGDVVDRVGAITS